MASSSTARLWKLTPTFRSTGNLWSGMSAHPSAVSPLQPMKIVMARPIGAEASEASRAWSRKALGGYLSLPLFRNAAYLWLNTIVLSGLGFVFWTAVARLYTADAVGYGASAIAAISLVASFSHLGLGFGIIRFLPERRESSAGLVNSVFLVTGATSLLASSVFLLGLDLWAPGLNAVL